MCCINPFDAVIHIGAMKDNQSASADIFLWNAYATKLLAEQVSNSQQRPPYFIFFSSSMVQGTAHDLDNRSPYGWSKQMAESYLVDTYEKRDSDGWCILCPSVIWGDEREFGYRGSIPFRLASHDLEFLLTRWWRDYVHVADIVDAVKICLDRKPNGFYDIMTGSPISNMRIREMIGWRDYKLVDDVPEGAMKWVVPRIDQFYDILPGWTPTVDIEKALPELETLIQRG